MMIDWKRKLQNIKFLEPVTTKFVEQIFFKKNKEQFPLVLCKSYSSSNLLN